MALKQHLDDKVRFDQQVDNSKSYVLPFIEKTHDIGPGTAVFEVGTAEGGVLLPFMERGCTCLGVDLAPERIELAKGFLANELAAGKVELRCQNIYDADFLATFSGKFDIIILKDVIEHVPESSIHADSGDSIETITSLIGKKTFASYRFEAETEETSNFTDEEFLETLGRIKPHIYRGDVFQIVPSRRYQRGFKGDDFNVYRALRSVNPSPYLFYFDYGSMRLMGSSPEAQIIIKSGRAEIHPIAGTFRRTGHDATDAERAAELQKDPKENAEHVMLVDLARNDLSRHCTNVTVDVYKEVQYYSHVIHLVSKVSGTLQAANDGTQDSVSIVADTFPAGTLSGAPKYMAMTLIDRYERGARGFYGGAVGFIDFNGDVNQAIMIRSMMSKNNTLTYQAGMGFVADSIPESELQEVHNKLGALRKAIAFAQNL